MNYMIDIETLSTRIDAAILEIGLAAFTDTHVVKSFKWLIIPEGHIDPNTVSWWCKQIHNGAPNPLDDQLDRMKLADALKDLGSRMKEVETIWAHRPSFDIPILGFAYEKTGIEKPWTYKQIRDTITIGELFPEVPRISPAIAHDSEADAVAQAQWMVNILSLIKVRRSHD